MVGTKDSEGSPLNDDLGTVYILGVRSVPMLSKVGFTASSPYARCFDYENYHGLKGLYVYGIVTMTGYENVERAFHDAMRPCRIRFESARELYPLPPALALATVAQTARSLGLLADLNVKAPNFGDDLMAAETTFTNFADVAIVADLVNRTMLRYDWNRRYWGASDNRTRLAVLEELLGSANGPAAPARPVPPSAGSDGDAGFSAHTMPSLSLGVSSAGAGDETLDDMVPPPGETWRVENGRLVIETELFGDLIIPFRLTADDARRLIARAQAFARKPLADNTRVTYRKAWDRYVAWCVDVAGADPLDNRPETVADHLMFLADPQASRRLDGTRITLTPLSRSSIGIARDAIAMGYKWAGLHLDTRHPAIAKAFEAIERMLSDETARKVEPITLPMLRKMIEATRQGPQDGGVKGARDRLALLLAWGSKFRRADLMAIDFGDVTVTDQGLLVTPKKVNARSPSEPVLVRVGDSTDPWLDVKAAFEKWSVLVNHSGKDDPVLASLNRGGMPTRSRLPERSFSNLVSELAEQADPEAVRDAERRNASYSADSLRLGGSGHPR